LVERRAAGTLTDLATQVVDELLPERDEPIPVQVAPDCAEAPAEFPGLLLYLLRHFSGRGQLASAFWVIGFGGLVLMVLVSGLLMTVGQGALSLVRLPVWVIFGTVAMASIWRCAYNTSWHGWGHLARAFVTALGVIPITGAVWALLMAMGR
jgi:hypothetical protein